MLPEPFLQFIFYNFHAKSSADSPLTSVSNWGKRSKKRIWGAQYVQQFIYLQFIISKMHLAENRIQNALSASRLSNQFLTAAQSSHFKIPVNSWLSAGCQLEVERLLSIQSSNTHSKQPISSLHLSQQSTQTHTYVNGRSQICKTWDMIMITDQHLCSSLKAKIHKI